MVGCVFLFSSWLCILFLIYCLIEYCIIVKFRIILLFDDMVYNLENRNLCVFIY